MAPIVVESLHALSLSRDLAVETDAAVDAVRRDGDRPYAGGHLERAVQPAVIPLVRHLLELDGFRDAVVNDLHLPRPVAVRADDVVREPPVDAVRRDGDRPDAGGNL